MVFLSFSPSSTPPFLLCVGSDCTGTSHPRSCSPEVLPSLRTAQAVIVFLSLFFPSCRSESGCGFDLFLNLRYLNFGARA